MNSNVKRVLYEGDKATGVLYVDSKSGEEFEQPADVVVLTSFTFNNIKLLLHSEIGTPYNPETKKGIIGNNFVDHNTSATSVTGFFEDKFNLYVATGALGMVYGDFNADNFDHTDLDFIHGGQVEYRVSGNNPIANNTVPEGTKQWGKDFKNQSLHYANRTLILAAQQSSMPHDDHYVDLDPTYKDKYGDPLLRITYDYTENDRKVGQFLLEKMEETIEEMGAIETIVNPQPEHFTPGFLYEHNSGGVIMGDSPDNSAVNNYMQMWEMENLFVCGASAFPHFGATNPTLTLGALTYRASEGIIDYLDGKTGMLVEAKTKTTLA